ncbi:LA_2272 family surface repeat-containing protein [Aquimarina muelleri]|uniref:PhaC PHA synthase n=1 Tax=Aquimarina muelleri TaxID=279356 RepID=A0A918JWF9_9FLAO|nr:hypothetical protein [Aquimarina muelleri]MCX2763983.1 hypothetical protein [Aquimarina muelleri]GGX22076.1 hypothetical protein GCM10007384_24100 [Aquimarina muelleri]
MKNTLFVIIFLFVVSSQSQEYNQNNKYLFWTFHTKNTTVNGISIGAFPSNQFVKTNGIRLEIPGFGFLAPLGNGSPISNVISVDEKFDRKKYHFNEIVNGINVSTGTIGSVNFNGITIAAIAQFGELSNGVAIAGVWNAMDKSNGAQLSLFFNEAIYLSGIQIALSNSAILMNGLQIGAVNYGQTVRGIQIGIFNKSKNTRGIQLGLWNSNEKRKTPILNWNFKT